MSGVAVLKSAESACKTTILPQSGEFTERNLSLQKVVKFMLAVGFSLIPFLLYLDVAIGPTLVLSGVGVLISSLVLYALKSIDNQVDGIKNNGSRLHEAAREGRLWAVKFFLWVGANPNTQDGHGDTPLHWASYTDQRAIVPLLIEAGADVNAVGNMGRVPLHYAVERVWDGTVKLLLEAGADPTIKHTSHVRRSPLEDAESTQSASRHDQYAHQWGDIRTNQERRKACDDIVAMCHLAHIRV
jgi:hypothetical protein